ncbi:MAG TPA: Rieske 2Fe-2S domain-containing protein [Roseiflexaceae bacterium]
MLGLRIVDAIAPQGWLDRLSQGLQKAVQSSFAAGGTAGQQAADLLHGTPLGHPLYPAVTDIPVGAWTVALVLDVLEAAADRDDLAPGADVAIGVGLAGALGAAATGLTDWKELDTKPLQWTAVLADAELPEGELRRVEIGDRAIVLARQHRQIYALAEPCSHLGGPLADGMLEDGCVVCPWHCSRFELATGEPIDGPAAIPQPCFATRVRDGRIEVQAGAEGG